MCLRHSVFRQHLRNALGGIVAGGEALGLAPVQHYPDALEHTTGGFGPLQPVRTECGENVGARDGVHPLSAKRLEDLAERRQPLFPVFLVLERSGVAA